MAFPSGGYIVLNGTSYYSTTGTASVPMVDYGSGNWGVTASNFSITDVELFWDQHDWNGTFWDILPYDITEPQAALMAGVTGQTQTTLGGGPAPGQPTNTNMAWKPLDMGMNFKFTPLTGVPGQMIDVWAEFPIYGGSWLAMNTYPTPATLYRGALVTGTSGTVALSIRFETGSYVTGIIVTVAWRGTIKKLTVHPIVFDGSGDPTHYLVAHINYTNTYFNLF